MRSAIRRPPTALPAIVLAGLAALAFGACGTESIAVPEDETTLHRGAELFSERCAGCHTMAPAGAQGSADRSQRVQGPNLDQRDVTYDDALYAIRNGGFSGAIMPQNIVVGEEARSVARFVAEYSGSDVSEPEVPEEEPGSDQAAAEDEEAEADSEQAPSGQPEDE